MNGIKTAMLLAALTALFMGLGYVFAGPDGALIALLIAAGMNLFTYWKADDIVLSIHRAHQVDRASAPELYGTVAALAQRAGLPMPKVYVIDSPHPNAFATGRSPQSASVAATTGLLQMLTREEIAAVMAHELAHVRNRDTLTMTLVATIAGAISMIANFGMFFGHDSEGRPNPLAAVLAVIVAPFAAMLVQLAISRTREFDADRLGAEICGNPTALAAALAKIAKPAKMIPNRISEQNPALSPLYIVPASVAEWFSTHPSTEQRIKALRALESRRRSPSDARRDHHLPRGRLPRSWSTNS